jgi:GT2 family glycosyltransferase
MTADSTQPAVTVVLVNYNSGALARCCLESVTVDLAGSAWSAIVIDNASADGSAAGLEGLPRTRIVRNATNVGFGRAVNQAARETDAPLLWLLNPDCEVVPGAFRALCDTLDRHGDCAITAPQLLNADGSVQASARGAPTAWTGLFGRHTLLTRFFPSSSMARRNLPAQDLVSSGVESAVVDWVMGASMLVRADLFRVVGGFDEGYFLYWEDADLCRRLRNRGWTTRYVPRARVRHPGGASAKSDPGLAEREFHRSAYRYYATHVVRSPLHPLRWLAAIALPLRAKWRSRQP